MNDVPSESSENTNQKEQIGQQTRPTVTGPNLVKQKRKREVEEDDFNSPGNFIPI
jgi:hypothetical protein